MTSQSRAIRLVSVRSRGEIRTASAVCSGVAIEGRRLSRLGRIGHNRPLGWAIGNDGLLVEIPEEQAARLRILGLRAGGATLRRIAKIITAEGFPISYSGVDRVLKQAATAAIAAE